MQCGAVLLWALFVLAIRQSIGLDLASGGPALATLLGLAAVAYLASGKRVEVDRGRGAVRTRWRLAGLPLGGSDLEMAIERVELRPEWMRSWRDGVSHKTLVYDLVLIGHPVGGDGSGEALAVDLKEDQLLFRRAERKARAAARVLDLPLAVRWDRLFGDLSRQDRPRGEWAERFAYPEALRDWRRWL